MKASSILFALLLVVFFYALGPGMCVYLGNIMGIEAFSSSAAKGPGVFLIIGGVLFNAYLVFFFRVVGKGSPVPMEGAPILMVQGPYRYVRNPMYLAHLIIWFGEFLFLGQPLILAYIFCMWGVLHLFLIYFEEPQLRKKFGEPYKHYLRTVHRWIPHIFFTLNSTDR